MKQIILTLSFILVILSAWAQDRFEHLKRVPGCFLPPEADSGWCVFAPELDDVPTPKPPAQLPGMPVVHLDAGLTLHFLSPEPIQYVDISTKNIEGDLPLKNLLRIREKENASFNDAVVTIVGETFIAQYHVLPGGSGTPAVTEIRPGDTHPLDISGISLSQPQLKKLAWQLFTSKGKPMEATKAFGLKATLNHVYTAGDYLFLDLSYRNKTRLTYDIDEFRFKVDDKKVLKAENSQSVELKPVFALFDVPRFQKSYRNIFVLKKLTFPGNKVLHIELNEKQFSGRVISLPISYKDVLNADIVPLN